LPYVASVTVTIKGTKSTGGRHSRFSFGRYRRLAIMSKAFHGFSQSSYKCQYSYNRFLSHSSKYVIRQLILPPFGAI
jgi:hypothetical protein